MPRARVPLLLAPGSRIARTDLGGMAAVVKFQHMLKCFEQSFAMAFVARVIDVALGEVRVADLCRVRSDFADPRPSNGVHRSPRGRLPIVTAC